MRSGRGGRALLHGRAHPHGVTSAARRVRVVREDDLAPCLPLLMVTVTLVWNRCVPFGETRITRPRRTCFERAFLSLPTRQWALTMRFLTDASLEPRLIFGTRHFGDAGGAYVTATDAWLAFPAASVATAVMVLGPGRSVAGAEN